MDYAYLVTLHVLAGVTWAGGVLFMGLAAVPVARKLPPELRRAVVTALGERARAVGWIALVVLVVTGVFLMRAWGATWASVLDGSFFAAGPRNQTLGWKLLAVTAMLAVTALHDWWLGPRHSRTEPGTPEAERYRLAASWMGRITGILVLVILMFAIRIARNWV